MPLNFNARQPVDTGKSLAWDVTVVIRWPGRVLYLNLRQPGNQ